MNHKAAPPLVFLVATLAITSCDEPHAPDTAQSTSSAAPVLAVAPNTWINRAPMPVERSNIALTAVLHPSGQSTLYAIGGRTPSGGSVGRVDAYNVATNTWSRKAQPPIAVFSTNGAGVISAKIYVSGGFTNFSSPRSNLFVYDPATNTWTKKRPMPTTGYSGLTMERLGNDEGPGAAAGALVL